MRVSMLFGRTLRDTPNDVGGLAAALLVRAAYLRPQADGGLAWLPLGVALQQQIEKVVTQWMEQQAGQRIQLGVAPNDQLVAPWFASQVNWFAQREIKSYRQLPTLLFQVVQNPTTVRFRGLPRLASESRMVACLLAQHQSQHHSDLATGLSRIWADLGLHPQPTTAEAGQVWFWPHPQGNLTCWHCPDCGYHGLDETLLRADDPPHPVTTTELPAATLVETPACATIADLALFLGVPESATAKAVFLQSEQGLVFVVIRGDLEVNLSRVQALLQVQTLEPATAAQISAVGAVPGYASPVGLRDVLVLADTSVVQAGPLVAGANQTGYHLRDVVYGRDWQAQMVAQIAMPTVPCCPMCGQHLSTKSGYEVARLRQQPSTLSYLDPSGVNQPTSCVTLSIEMDRMILLAAEQFADANGLHWPARLAPFHVHVVALLPRSPDPAIRQAFLDQAEALVQQLTTAGFRVLFDERDESAGVKFNDADLIGMPLRIVISERLLAAGQLELKPRGGEVRKIEAHTLLNELG